MKKVNSLILIVLIFTSCVSKTKYDELVKKSESFQKEITVLKAHIDELENGEERIVNLAKNAYADGKYNLAEVYIKQLKEKHPESKEIAYFVKLQPQLDKFIMQEKETKEKARIDSIKLVNINNLGNWSINHYVDDFGEATKEPYITTFVNGTFSNSATTNSELNVRFLIDKDDIRIQLYEYAGNHPIKGEGLVMFKIRDKNNKEFNIRAHNSDYGNTTVESEHNRILRNILISGGNIKFVAETGGLGTPSIYKFSIDNADYFENALTKMKLSK
jgi:hypothetical protein